MGSYSETIQEQSMEQRRSQDCSCQKETICSKDISVGKKDTKVTFDTEADPKADDEKKVAAIPSELKETVNENTIRENKNVSTDDDKESVEAVANAAEVDKVATINGNVHDNE